MDVLISKVTGWKEELTLLSSPGIGNRLVRVRGGALYSNRFLGFYPRLPDSIKWAEALDQHLA